MLRRGSPADVLTRSLGACTPFALEADSRVPGKDGPEFSVPGFRCELGLHGNRWQRSDPDIGTGFAERRSDSLDTEPLVPGTFPGLTVPGQT